MAAACGGGQSAGNTPWEFTMRSIVTMLLSFALSIAAAAAPQPPAHVHSHDHGEPAAMANESGERWAADAPLRQGMQQVRDARTQAIRSPDDAAAMATAIDAAVGYMIRNCSLPADADAALHGVIGQLGSATNSLRRDDDPGAGIAMIDSALERYAQLFNETVER
jgi:hypothetical protein